ncbi:MAG: hypothetical protein HYT31_02530 [Parcubacteria group bacterium]|nr:hypothetical protein [Parcubacteria group bacterium]
MISYAAHIPHSPLLLPQISRGKFRQFKKMHQAVAQIKHDIYSRGCDTLILLSPYASPNRAHLLNISPQFSASFEAYGSFGASFSFPGDATIAYQIRSRLGTEHLITAITSPRLDSASASAAVLLSPPDAAYRLLPVYAASMHPLEQLYEFGKKLRDVLECAGGKIGVVSLGDLSRTASQSREEGRKLDLAIVKSLHEHDTESLLGHAPAELSRFSLGALSPLALMKGILDGIKCEADVLNYEQKYGVGMMAVRFI